MLSINWDLWWGSKERKIQPDLAWHVRKRDENRQYHHPFDDVAKLIFRRTSVRILCIRTPAPDVCQFVFVRQSSRSKERKIHRMCDEKEKNLFFVVFSVLRTPSVVLLNFDCNPIFPYSRCIAWLVRATRERNCFSSLEREPMRLRRSTLYVRPDRENREREKKKPIQQRRERKEGNHRDVPFTACAYYFGKGEVTIVRDLIGYCESPNF